MTDAEKAWRRRVIAVIAGVLLALTCRELPPEYRVLCDAIAQSCSGGKL